MVTLREALREGGTRLIPLRAKRKRPCETTSQRAGRGRSCLGVLGCERSHTCVCTVTASKVILMESALTDLRCVTLATVTSGGLAMPVK